MIFRTTQRVSSKLGVACIDMSDRRPSMVEWYCNLITVRRRQFFLFTHAPSLFSFWTPAAGSTRDAFGAMFRRRATETLRQYEFSETDAANVLDDGPDVFARATDRSVIGSMVDFAKMCRHVVDHEGGLEHMSPGAMNDIANESPMSKIGMANPTTYLREVLRRERPHHIAVHRTAARGARPAGGRCGVNVSEKKLSPSDSIRTADVLLKAGIDINQEAFREHNWKATPLWYAVSRGQNLRLASQPSSCSSSMAPISMRLQRTGPRSSVR